MHWARSRTPGTWWPGTGRKEGFLCQKLQDGKLCRKSLSKAGCGMWVLEPSSTNGVSCALDVCSLRRFQVRRTEWRLVLSH